MEETNINLDNPDADCTLTAESCTNIQNGQTQKHQTPQTKSDPFKFDTVVKRPKQRLDTCKNDELEFYKVKFNAAMEVIKRVEPFMRQLKSSGSTFTPSASTPLDPNTSFLNPGKHCNGQVFVNGSGFNGGHNGPTIDQFELVAKERDSLRKELKELEIGYSSLFKRYEKLRDDCTLLKNSEESLQIKLEEERNMYEALQNRFYDLRDGASRELERANDEVDRQAKSHDEATLGLRIRLRKLESELQTKDLTLNGKDNQIKELNELCDELTKKFEACTDGNSSLSNGLMDF